MEKNTLLHHPDVVTLDEDEASSATGFSKKTLQKRRWERKPPAFLKVGRLVRYRLSDILAFLDSCTVTPRG